LLLVLAAGGQALAKGKGRAPAPTNQGYISITKGLVPSHKYRLDISSTGHVKFVGQGFQDYTYVNNHMLGEGTKPLSVKGTTPRSFVLTIPVKGDVRSWIIGLAVQDTVHKPLKVRLVDLGHKP
jgi:hypothetical protein